MMFCEKNVIVFDLCARLLLCHTLESADVLTTQQTHPEMNKTAAHYPGSV